QSDWIGDSGPCLAGSAGGCVTNPARNGDSLAVACHAGGIGASPGRDGGAADGTQDVAHPERPDRSQLVLQVRDVSLSFGGIKALRGVGFDVARGEILSVIGPNGAGKTSIANVIS